MENNEKEREIITTEEDMNENDTAHNVNNNKEESREFYVYKHIRKDNNTCFYVGKGKGRRIKVPKRNKHFNRIRKKYGCYVVKIKENLTEKEAFALEREIIEDYVFVFGYGINIKGYYKGYNENERLTNCTWGGEGVSGMHHSEETKQRMSEKRKGEKNPMFGKNAYANKTPEEMEEIGKKKSEALKGKNPYANKTPEEMEEIGKKISGSISGEKHPMFGKHYSEEHNKKIGEANSKKVICITTGKKFDSIKDASDYYKCNNINACCKGRLKSAGKLNGVRLQWKYLEDYDDNCLEEYKLNISDKRSKKVICITTGETFDSITEASNYYNASQNSISKCCRGELKSAGELNGVRLQWKYLEDYDDNCLEEYKLNISDKRSKKVICITTGETFDSIKDAEKYYKCNHIGDCCIGKYKHAGKLNGIRLQWKYVEDDDNESKAV